MENSHIADNMVIDGWNRYSACQQVGIDCAVTHLDPSIDPRDFVMAQNKARRHITQAQLAMATVAVYEWHPAHRVADKEVDTQYPLKTNAELSGISGVGERTIKQAKVVQSQAAPSVAAAVQRGEIGLPKAAAIAQLPKDQQAEPLLLVHCHCPPR
ncbi:MAG: hypothetical protein QX198_14415 [Methylococcaceae bacterium]